MTKSLLALALVLTAASSAFAAPVRATEAQKLVLIRATQERLFKQYAEIREFLKANTASTVKCDASDQMYRMIEDAGEVYVDAGEQPVLIFVTNPSASREGETKLELRIRSNAEETKITGMMLSEITYKETLVGKISNPSYVLMPIATSKTCSLAIVPKDAPVRNPSSNARSNSVLKPGSVLRK